MGMFRPRAGYFPGEESNQSPPGLRARTRGWPKGNFFISGSLTAGREAQHGPIQIRQFGKNAFFLPPQGQMPCPGSRARRPWRGKGGGGESRGVSRGNRYGVPPDIPLALAERARRSPATAGAATGTGAAWRTGTACTAAGIAPTERRMHKLHSSASTLNSVRSYSAINLTMSLISSIFLFTTPSFAESAGLRRDYHVSKRA